MLVMAGQPFAVKKPSTIEMAKRVSQSMMAAAPTFAPPPPPLNLKKKDKPVEEEEIITMADRNGTICRWLEERGFGFITPEDGGWDDLFCHLRALVNWGSNGNVTLKVGDYVSYNPQWNGRKNMWEATNVRIICSAEDDPPEEEGDG
eukprot:gnl/MRDRNA2_/MRDRNA2_164235_c0_seq1.p1 gnl/MRDRNA2_/MRDRNA2_164235_c0~~gnl/MRDRNA2_/MRDRNA2_164235_c0_seq1.p1  ORF type:complete len:147 (+),score=31.17 gnl/MRDRNA2_/MRDRNA2_164235_c0_seq1:3-443(+)